MRNRIRIFLAMLTAGLTVLAFVVAPAAAAGGNTQVSGEGVYDTTGACHDFPNVEFPYPPIMMSGGLVGCWYTNTANAVHVPPGVYRETGDETFVGCLSDGTTCGTFNTTYHFEAKLATDGSEIHGKCEHPLVSGTGDFAGLKGIIFIQDDVANAKFDYRGHIDLP
ncbi:MAG: hypothetical protein ACM30E_03840 [Nitrososphaerales archaeon]